MPYLSRTPKKSWEHRPDKQHKAVFSRDASFYHTTEWRKCRKAYIDAHPLCECKSCSRRMVPLPAQHVDHIIPIKDGGDPLSWDNLQALNARCHNKKSAKERR